MFPSNAFLKGMLLRNIAHCLQKRIYEKFEISEMKLLNFFSNCLHFLFLLKYEPPSANFIFAVSNERMF